MALFCLIKNTDPLAWAFSRAAERKKLRSNLSKLKRLLLSTHLLF